MAKVTQFRIETGTWSAGRSVVTAAEFGKLVLGGSIGAGGAALFSPAVADAAPGASVDNYSPTGYAGGVTKRLAITAASGGTTVNGLSTTNVPDGFTVMILNPSTTDALIFPHLASSSSAANRFSNAGASPVQIPPLGAANATNIAGTGWVFS